MLSLAKLGLALLRPSLARLRLLVNIDLREADSLIGLSLVLAIMTLAHERAHGQWHHLHLNFLAYEVRVLKFHLVLLVWHVLSASCNTRRLHEGSETLFSLRVGHGENILFL